jgi:hypothetical protein
LPSRFRFHAHAIGAGGRIRNPFQEIVEVQAASALPEIGGYGSGRVQDFKYREIIHFDHAHTEVTGSSTGQDGGAVHNTLAKSTVEGLNIMGMVTADRVVANLVAAHPEGRDVEPSIKLTGTRFENLRIAGVPVKVDLALDIFNRLDTHQGLTAAYRDDAGFRRHFAEISHRERFQELPGRVQRWFHRPAADDSALPETKGITSLTLVRRLEPERQEFQCWGHVIYLEGFGTIRLAELQISRYSRRLTMVQVDLGSPVDGEVMAASIEGNGTDW